VTWSNIEQRVALEYERLGIPLRFRMVSVEKNGAKKFPKLTYVNKEINDSQIKKISFFRREGRFPTVCYIHRRSGCALYRSAEPE